MTAAGLHTHPESPTQRSRRREARLRIAIALNLVVVVGQVAFGIVAGSLGLLSDAGHNLTDVAALALSMVAIRIARRAPTSSRSFGWHRGTVLAAQANAAMILVLTVWITYEAITRMIDPSPVEGGIVLVVALVGFAANAAAAVVVHEKPTPEAASDLNMRSALLHLVSDAAASLGVALAGLVMVVTGGWERLDPAVSLLIGLSIGWQAWRLLSASNAVLLEGTPEGLDPADIGTAMAADLGVETVHDLHVWSISSDVRALSAHLVIDGHPSLEEAQIIAARVKQGLAERFGITHATLELECETCEDVGPACDMDLVETSEPRPGAHHH